MSRYGKLAFDFGMGVAGGALNMPTGRPSGMGAAGEMVGRGGRAYVDSIRGGQQYGTNRQIAQTRRFASTGQQTPPPGGQQG